MVELTEQEAHCIARLLQSAIFSPDHDLFAGCRFCKYPCAKESGTWCDMHLVDLPRYDAVMHKLMEETGVDLGPAVYGYLDPSVVPFKKFPYKKFIKNSNEEIKEFFRNYFKDI